MKAAIFLGKFLLDERFKVGSRLCEAEREEAKETASALGRPSDQFEDGTKECFQNFLHRDRPIAHFGLKSVEQSEARFVQRFHPPIQHRENEGVLGRKVIVDRGEINSGSGRDGAKGSRAEAMGRDKPFGRVEDSDLGGMQFFRHDRSS